MQLLLISDIFGQNSGLDDLANALTTIGIDIQILDPYQGKRLHFMDGAHAYQSYLDQCGHDYYCQMVINILAKISQSTSDKIIIIAFSAGASAAWQALGSNKIETEQVKQFIGFYPSQIRHHLHLTPKVMTQLFFPAHEEHFSVDTTIAELSRKNTVRCIKTKGLHSFMNPLSINFDQIHTQYFIKTLLKIIN